MNPIHMPSLPTAIPGGAFSTGSYGLAMAWPMLRELQNESAKLATGA